MKVIFSCLIHKDGRGRFLDKKVWGENVDEIFEAGFLKNMNINPNLELDRYPGWYLPSCCLFVFFFNCLVVVGFFFVLF